METSFDNYTLRLISPTDLEDYFELIERNRKRLEDFFAGTVAITKTKEDTAKHLADVLLLTEQGKYFSFVIADNTTGKLIASIQVKNVDLSIPKAELGYYIDEGYEGKGLATKAVSYIIGFCFNTLHFNKLYIRTYEKNISSRKVAENNGFIVEGIIRMEYKTTAGQIIDCMYYGLINPVVGGRVN